MDVTAGRFFAISPALMPARQFSRFWAAARNLRRLCHERFCDFPGKMSVSPGFRHGRCQRCKKMVGDTRIASHETCQAPPLRAAAPISRTSQPRAPCRSSLPALPRCQTLRTTASSPSVCTFRRNLHHGIILRSPALSPIGCSLAQPPQNVGCSKSLSTSPNG